MILKIISDNHMHNKEANEMNIHVKIINESGKFEARQSMCEFSC